MCEQCGKNLAQVRVDQIIQGQRTRRILCLACAGEIPALSNILGGFFDSEPQPDMAFPFGFNFNQEHASTGDVDGHPPWSLPGSPPAASKTPTLDHFGRDLTGEAALGKLDP